MRYHCFIAILDHHLLVIFFRVATSPTTKYTTTNMTASLRATLGHTIHHPHIFSSEGKDDIREFGSFELSHEYRVSFEARAHMRYTIHANDYSDEEYFSCWYTPDELAEMKFQLIDTLKRFERHEEVDEINDTFRGLETHTKSGRINKLRSRSTAIETVIGMVYKQIKAGKEINDERLAQVYGEVTKTSELAAYLSGLGDQGTVRDLDMSFNSESVRRKKGPRRCGFALVLE